AYRPSVLHEFCSDALCRPCMSDNEIDRQWRYPMSWHRQWVASLVMVVVSCFPAIVLSAEVNVAIPAPLVDNPKASGPLQTAVIAGGCFWGVQGVFEHVRGVTKVLSGYSGGEKSTAQYEMVSSGRTGHAESVQIVFDP